MKNQGNHTRHHVGLILALVGLISAATLVLGSAGTASAQLVYPSWANTGNLNTARSCHTATLLPNANVLVAGGFGSNGASSNSSELYDIATGTWTTTGNLITARACHTAT